jgi:hypothetical protein
LFFLTKNRFAVRAHLGNAPLRCDSAPPVDDLPVTVEDAKLHAAIEKLLSKYPPEEVAVYLHAFYTMNQAQWPNLEAILKTDKRLQFGG